MTHAQIVQKIALLKESTEEEAEMFLNAFIKVISMELQRGNDIFINEFGDFCVHTICDTNKINSSLPTREIIFLPDKTLQAKIDRW